MAVSHQDTNNQGYEHSDVDLPKTLIAGAGVVVFLIISLIGLNEYFMVVSERQYEQDVLLPESLQLQEQRIKENEALHRYTVVDANKGIYSIPIGRAMQVMSQKP